MLSASDVVHQRATIAYVNAFMTSRNLLQPGCCRQENANNTLKEVKQEWQEQAYVMGLDINNSRCHEIFFNQNVAECKNEM